MRALQESFSAFPSGTVVYYKATATQGDFFTLGAGTYRVTVVGSGGGCATHGYSTTKGTSSATGSWAYGCGGGGAAAVVVFRIMEQANAIVAVAAGGTGTANTNIYDEFTPGEASGADGASSMFTIRLSQSTIGAWVMVYGGKGGTAMSIDTGSTLGAGGNGGDASQADIYGDTILSSAVYSGVKGSQTGRNSVTEILEPAGETTVEGGAAGVAEAGANGRGGGVVYRYDGTAVTFSGGNGADGLVIVEKIG